MNLEQWITDFFATFNHKNDEGTLTVGDAAIHNGFYRLLEGVNAGRVIITSCARIDGQPIGLFANGMTWFFIDKLKDVRCERVHPTFNHGKQPIDYSQATWYNDNSDVPQHHEW